MNKRTLDNVKPLLCREFPVLLEHKRNGEYCVAQAYSPSASAKPTKLGVGTFPLLISHWRVVEERNYAVDEPPLCNEITLQPENSGGSCDYYKCFIENPTTAEEQYTAECNDVIEALDMTYAEANMFKEIWRSAAARTLGKVKEGHTAKRGAEKIVFFANRNAIQKGVRDE